jgi:hypothetical protein
VHRGFETSERFIVGMGGKPPRRDDEVSDAGNLLHIGRQIFKRCLRAVYAGAEAAYAGGALLVKLDVAEFVNTLTFRRGISHTSSTSRRPTNELLPLSFHPYQIGSYRRWYLLRPSTNTSLPPITVADQWKPHDRSVLSSVGQSLAPKTPSMYCATAVTGC